MIGGFGLALLPGHLGLPLLVVGLIMVLRHSPRARRQFVTLQHRHPRFIFPVRRLIRREPEVFPVAWQQLLRHRADDVAAQLAAGGPLAPAVLPRQW